jgi:hypothetical protein
MFRITAGTALQRQLDELAQLRSTLPSVIEQALSEAGTSMIQNLTDAAPRGTNSGGTPPEGDASGPLAESFSASVAVSGSRAKLTVKTSQPTKLKYVTQGTGLYGPYKQRIYPRVKKALYWEGAEHPVRSVAGQEPNDFVSPITDEADEDINAVVSDAISEVMNG